MTACHSGQNRQSRLESELQEAFRTICLARQGLNYPKYSERAKDCFTSKDEDWLKTFDAIMAAKQFIDDQIQTDRPGESW